MVPNSTFDYRFSGVLLHPSSLPGESGCGTFGNICREWIKLLSRNKISVWQFLPLSPTDASGSPYSSPSSFSLNPWFLDANDLAENIYTHPDAFKLLSNDSSKNPMCIMKRWWEPESNNIDFTLLDIINDPPQRDILVDAMKALDDRKKLLNTSGKSYREIGAEVVKKMTDEEVIEALSADGKLIKRPLAVTDEHQILVGFNPDVWTEMLLR